MGAVEPTGMGMFNPPSPSGEARNPDPPPQPRAQPVTLYSYHVEKIPTNLEVADQATLLSNIGAQGWQLRAMGAVEGDGSRRAWFEFSYAATDTPPNPPVTR